MKLEWIRSAEVKGVVGGIKGQKRRLSGWKGWHQVSRQTDEPCSTSTAAFWLLHYAAQRPSRGITNVSVYSWLLPSTDFSALSRMGAHTKKLTCTFRLKKKKALGIFDQPEIWLSQTCFLCALGFMWRALVVTHSCHLFVCVKGSYVSVNGRSSMPGVFTCTRANSSYCLSSSTGTNSPDTKWFIAVFV